MTMLTTLFPKELPTTFGWELEYNGRSPSEGYSKYTAAKVPAPEWGPEHCGCESRSPVFTETSAVDRYLDVFFDTVKNKHTIYDSCGCHIHVGLRPLLDYNPKTLVAMNLCSRIAQEFFFSLMPESRRKNRFCSKSGDYLYAEKALNHIDFYLKSYWPSLINKLKYRKFIKELGVKLPEESDWKTWMHNGGHTEVFGECQKDYRNNPFIGAFLAIQTVLVGASGDVKPDKKTGKLRYELNKSAFPGYTEWPLMSYYPGWLRNNYPSHATKGPLAASTTEYRLFPSTTKREEFEGFLSVLAWWIHSLKEDPEGVMEHMLNIAPAEHRLCASPLKRWPPVLQNWIAARQREMPKIDNALYLNPVKKTVQVRAA